MIYIKMIFVFVILTGYGITKAQNRQTLQDEKAGFMVQFKDEVCPYRVFGAFVMPEEEIPIETIFENRDQEFFIISSGGVLEQLEGNKWTWIAPDEKGVYPLTIFSENKSDSIQLNFIVKVPHQKINNKILNGYRIGSYAQSGNPMYKIPEGFIEVTRSNLNTKISPNFELKDFLCKQKSTFPKYIVLRERLVLKLEMMLEQLNKNGYKAESFAVMSGYRTPYYNKAIGNVKYSRHLYGDASDIYVDENNDNQMDDLNGDGENNVKALFSDHYSKIEQRKWVHLTAVFDGNSFRIYKNGILMNEKENVNIQINGTSNQINIGAIAGVARFVGNIDEVKIYSRALISEEVYANAKSISYTGNPVPPDNLKVNRFSNTEAIITWNDVSDLETKFQVERSNQRNNEFEVIGTIYR